jgi:S1-C subfamily serine protease
MTEPHDYEDLSEEGAPETAALPEAVTAPQTAALPAGQWHPSTGAPMPEPYPQSPRKSRAGVVIAALTAALTLLAGIGIGYVIGRNDESHTLGMMRRAQGPLTQFPQGGEGGFQMPGGVPGETIPGFGGGYQMPGSGMTGQQSLTPAQRSTATKVMPAVVDINTQTTSSGFAGGSTHPFAAGTGMIISSGGEVLTNNHVVEGAMQISLTIPGHSGTYGANVVGVDPTADVALLQIQNPPSNLPTVSLSSGSSVSVGTGVIAIGNALGKGGTPSVTFGSVTALNQSIKVNNDRGGFENLSGMIRSSATVLPGDSGGAMVDSSGQVVGMLTASSTTSTTSGAVSFAIPVNNAMSVVSQIRSGQSSSTVYIGQVGYLGVGVVNFQSHAVAGWKVKPSAGALVVGVAPGTPAAKAGLARGAVIVSVDGTSISSPTDLEAPIHTHKPSESVSVSWIDASGRHTANITLISGPAA